MVHYFAKRLIAALSCALLMLLCACAPGNEVPSAPPSSSPGTKNTPGETARAQLGEGVWEIVFYATGKSDAILLLSAQHALMIDTGYAHSAPHIVNNLKSRGVEALDYLILTHFDKDHIGGAPTLLSSIAVKSILQPVYAEGSDAYVAYESALASLALTPTPLTQDTAFTLGDASFTVYAPHLPEYDNENNSSLLISMLHGENSLLFAGDAKAKRLEEMLSVPALAHDLLKLPHHGSFNKNTAIFLSAVSPTYAIITCSEQDPPDPQTLATLDLLPTQTYLTTNGPVLCTSNGKTLDVRQ